MSNRRPLNFWTADGDHATENMLVKYDSKHGISYAGPLRNQEGITFGWPADFARINKDVYGVDADRRRLYKLNGDTGICAPLKSRLRYPLVFGLAYDDVHKKLYAVDKVTHKLLLLDRLEGNASELLTLPALHSDIRGIAYNGSNNSIYYSDESTESIYRCDLATGRTELVLALRDGPHAIIEELEFYDGRLFASFMTFRESIWSMQVMEIDARLGAKHLIGPVINDLSGHCLLINSMPERIFWRQISGPTPALFSDVSDPYATVSLPETGVYVFELVTTGNGKVIADSIIITAIF